MPIEAIIRVLFAVCAVALVGIILLQRGKGTDIGASFGGGGAQTLFGPAGSAGLLVKVTTVLATLFFLSSFALAFLAKQRVDRAVWVDAPNAVEYTDGALADDLGAEPLVDDYDVPVVDGAVAPVSADGSGNADVGEPPDLGSPNPAGP